MVRDKCDGAMSFCDGILECVGVFADDHHPPPTFTPPELPKKVHVRGTKHSNFKMPTFVIFYMIRFAAI